MWDTEVGLAGQLIVIMLLASLHYHMLRPDACGCAPRSMDPGRRLAGQLSSVTLHAHHQWTFVPSYTSAIQHCHAPQISL